MEHATLVKHLEAIIDALERDTGVTWNLADYGTNYDFETRSDAGEDVIISLYGSTLEELARDARNALKKFDADEHAAKILIAKREGNEEARRYYAAAPNDLHALLADAELIAGYHLALYKMLEWRARHDAA